MSLANTGEGFGHAAAYQVPGIPWVSGSISLDTTPQLVRFPKVTRSIKVRTMTGNAVRVGFTSNGVNGNNYFRVMSGSTENFDVRVSEMYIRMETGAGSCDVIAGLTLIPGHIMGSLTGSMPLSEPMPGSGWPGVG